MNLEALNAMLENSKQSLRSNSVLSLNEGINDQNIFKAVFMAGGPGSGKSFISDRLIGRKSAVSALGAVVVNSDAIFERKLTQAGLPSKMDTENPELYAKQMAERELSKALSDKRMGYWLDGMLPVLIDGTGKNYGNIKKKALALKSIGYDVGMVFVNTTLDVALARNQERERVVSPDLVKTMWDGVQKNIGKFQSLFGSSFVIIDLSKTLSGSEAQHLEKKIFNVGQKLFSKPLKNRIGIATIGQMKSLKVKTLSELAAKASEIKKAG